jgi:hypothetical protein
MNVEMRIDFNKEHKTLPSVKVFLSGEFYTAAHMDDLIRSLMDARTWLAKKERARE